MSLNKVLGSGTNQQDMVDCEEQSIRPIRPANEIYNAKLSISFAGQLRGKLCLFSPAPSGS